GAGGDPAGMTTRAVKDGSDWVINGRKIWVSRVPYADFVILMARTGEGKRHEGITAFIVEKGTKGFIIEREIPMLGGHRTYELVFEDCRVPARQMLGKLGHGFAPMQLRLTVRRLQMGAWCVGMSRRALDMMMDHAKQRSTFGVKLAGLAFEAHRNALRLERAFAQVSVGGISGAVGTYAATSPEFEARVLARLGLERESVSTQVVARDRHAELLSAIALAGAGMERLATEVRHLQRTEVREVQEPFRGGQKGSSAMPHKRNPIKAEQISGLARVLRGNAQAGLENVALWHERDISHSSVERIVLGGSTTLIDYLQHRATALVEGMTIDAERMRENLELTYGAIFSQRLLLALVESGMSRDDAYYAVQRVAQQAWDTRTPLRELLAAEGRAGLIPAALDLDGIFDYGHYVRYAREIVARLDETV
ncbi:MAG: lyase family protein, partial [Solirubrobacteraceae bacterium]